MDICPLEHWNLNVVNAETTVKTGYHVIEMTMNVIVVVICVTLTVEVQRMDYVT